MGGQEELETGLRDIGQLETEMGSTEEQETRVGGQEELETGLTDIGQ